MKITEGWLTPRVIRKADFVIAEGSRIDIIKDGDRFRMVQVEPGLWKWDPAGRYVCHQALAAAIERSGGFSTAGEESSQKLTINWDRIGDDYYMAEVKDGTLELENLGPDKWQIEVMIYEGPRGSVPGKTSHVYEGTWGGAAHLAEETLGYLRWSARIQLGKAETAREVGAKYNLRAHQVLHAGNIKAIIDIVKNDARHKNLAVEFLEQLLEQAPLLEGLLDERERSTR